MSITKPKSEVTTIRMPTETLWMLRRYAEDADCSVSRLIREAVNEWLRKRNQHDRHYGVIRAYDQLVAAEQARGAKRVHVILEGYSRPDKSSLLDAAHKHYTEQGITLTQTPHGFTLSW